MIRNGRPPRVLIVDDDRFILRLLARQFESIGIPEVHCFERTPEAVAHLTCASTSEDLVLCDLQMPEMDGVQFVRELARIGFAGGVVLVSGENERILHTAEKLASAHGLRVLGALHKPLAPAQLRHVLELHAARTATPPRAVRRTYGADEVRRAIAERQLVNHYQPKVDVATFKLAGVETLVRWRHPDDGLIYPDQFITTAEHSGLIDELMMAVLEGALAQARIWHGAGLPLHVAVNVSMENLASLDFPDFVAREAARAGVPVSSLVLEVTESRLMCDPRKPLDVLTRLRLKHIGLSIDDFGTGHSSLAQLRDIPFDELKIDRSFIHGAWREAALGVIVEASLGMARQLGMKTVAEGVEDRDDWNFLRAAGCDLAQGYFIGRPMPAEDLASWMSAWDARVLDFSQRAA